MRAWRLERPGGALLLEDMPKPAPCPGGVLVRVEASTLMSYIKAYVEGRLPGYRAPDGTFTPGGNAVGVIEALGPGVVQLALGQRVVLSPLVISAEPVPDPAQILLGVTSFGGASDRLQAAWRDGTLADYAVLPASALVPVDEELAGIPSPQLAVASLFVVPFGGLLRGRLAAGETVIVNGASGAYGSAAVLLAVAMGAGRIVAAGRNAAKLRHLAGLAGPVVTPVALTGDRSADAVALREAAGGGATDANSTLAALNALRQRGRLVLMGSMQGDLPVPYLQMMLNGLEIIGNFMHPPDAYRRVLALVRAGRLDLTAIAPRLYPLEALPAAMAAAEKAGNLEAVVMAPGVPA